MHTRRDARERLARHVADLRTLIERVERHADDARLAAAITELGERMTNDLLALYRLREQGIDAVLHGTVEPALEQARNALRTARARPGTLARTLRIAAEALSSAA